MWQTLKRGVVSQQLGSQSGVRGHSWRGVTWMKKIWALCLLVWLVGYFGFLFVCFVHCIHLGSKGKSQLWGVTVNFKNPQHPPGQVADGAFLIPQRPT